MRATFSPGVFLLVALAIGACRNDARAKGDAAMTVSEPFALPGAHPLEGASLARLADAWAQKPPGYVARTRNVQPDGAPKFVNRMFLEASPYLRQHAHNPVDFRPWGDEAFADAKRLGRPVLLSVGYSTCHWCHVMEEESFDDVETARYLNEHYVVIKVDREERPDVDAIYMAAVQQLHGSGGWPMTVWLTPDRKPFFAGTYFPPKGERSFRVHLEALGAAYAKEPEKVASDAARVAQKIEKSLGSSASTLAGVDPARALDAALSSYEERFDATEGGIRRAPKFPSDLPLRWLLRAHLRGKSEAPLRMARVTLERMAAGGIHDHIGGGFHRYSTDAKWRVPHFEKMLYDNALLAMAYAEAAQATGERSFEVVARDVLGWVDREMSSADGAFFSATDADSLAKGGERKEGVFFTWTPAEIASALGPERGVQIARALGVTEPGNLEGRSVPHLTSVASLEITRALDDARPILLRVRAQRPAPLRDDKVLAGWNGLMISALARAGAAFGDEALIARAARASDAIATQLVIDGRLRRSVTHGFVGTGAFLDDHAFLVAASLDLYEATGERRFLERALSLSRVVERHFADPGGGWFQTADDAETLLVREKSSWDGAVPSGASVHVMNLLRLHAITGDAAHRSRAELANGAASSILASSPTSVSELLLAIDFASRPTKQIVLVAKERAELAPFLAVVRATYLPHKVVVAATEDEIEKTEPLAPFLSGKRTRGGKATAYVCELGTCRLPTTDPSALAKQLVR